MQTSNQNESLLDSSIQQQEDVEDLNAAPALDA